MPQWLKDNWQLFVALVLVAGAFFRVESVADSNKEQLGNLRDSNSKQWQVISRNANDIARLQGKIE